MATKKGDKARQGESTCPLGKVDRPPNKGKQEAVKGESRGEKGRQDPQEADTIRQRERRREERRETRKETRRETRGDKTLGKAGTPANGEIGDTRGHKGRERDTRGDKRTQGETRPSRRRTHPN